MENQVLKAIKERRSVRSYTEQKLTQEQIDLLCQAALEAPSARNIQPWKIIVVKNSEIIAEMEHDTIEYFKEINDEAMLKRISDKDHVLFYKAPAVIFIAINKNDISKIDAGIAIENIALAAQSMGLGSVIVAMSRFLLMTKKCDYWREKLGFPEDYIFGVSIAVGYPADTGNPHETDHSKVFILE